MLSSVQRFLYSRWHTKQMHACFQLGLSAVQTSEPMSKTRGNTLLVLLLCMYRIMYCIVTTVSGYIYIQYRGKMYCCRPTEQCLASDIQDGRHSEVFCCYMYITYRIVYHIMTTVLGYISYRGQMYRCRSTAKYTWLCVFVSLSLKDFWFSREERLLDSVKIALVGKYTKFQDAYLSVIKALKHASLHCNRHLDVVVSCWD